MVNDVLDTVHRILSVHAPDYSMGSKSGMDESETLRERKSEWGREWRRTVVPVVEERAFGASSDESVGDILSGYNEDCECECAHT